MLSLKKPKVFALTVGRIFLGLCTLYVRTPPKYPGGGLAIRIRIYAIPQHVW